MIKPFQGHLGIFRNIDAHSATLRHNSFCKTLDLECLTLFWIRLCLDNCSKLRLFRYIQAYSSMFSIIKGPLSGRRRFLETESPLKSMRNAFYFILKALFVLKTLFVLTFWLCIKPTWLGSKINFKIYDVTLWLTNDCNTHIAQYLKK